MESLINQQSTLHYDISANNGISHNNNNNNCNNNNNNKNKMEEMGSFKKPIHPSSSNGDGLLSPSSYIIQSSDNEDDSTNTSLDISTSSMLSQQYQHQQQQQPIYHHQVPVIDLYQVPIYQHNMYLGGTPLPPSQPNIYSSPPPPIYKYLPSSPPIFNSSSTNTIIPDPNAIQYTISPTSPPQSSYYYVVSAPVHSTQTSNFYSIPSQNASDSYLTSSSSSSPNLMNKKRPFDQISLSKHHLEEDDDELYQGEEEEDKENEEEEEEGEEEEEEEDNENEESIEQDSIMKSEFTTPQKPNHNNYSISNTNGNAKITSESESNVTTPSLSSPSLPSPSPILSPTSLSNILSLSLPNSNNNRENVIYVHVSEIQESIYRNLLKENIPKLNSKEHDQSTVLMELYNLLVTCCNHPSLLNQHQQTLSNLIQNSGKLLNLEKLFESLPKSQNHSKKVIILTYFDTTLSILNDYLNLKSLKYYSNINSFYNGGDNFNILITTFQNFNQYHQQNLNQSINNCVIIEYDQFFDIQNMNSSIITQNYLKSMYFNTNDFTNNFVYKLISYSTVEEWVYLFKNNQSINCSQLNIKNELIDMMKFCIVKMSNYKKSTPQPPTTTNTNTSTVTLTPISVLVNSMSSSNLWKSNSASKTSLIDNSNGIPTSQESINTTNSTTTKTGKSSKSNKSNKSGDNSTTTSNVSDKKKKKHRSPKKQKVNGDRTCFSCKKEEDSNGNSAFVQCRSCPMTYHRTCVGLQSTPRSWKCIRHFCSQCKKTPNESGGSFFICKSCPISYCITCLPDGVKILKKNEYIERKNKSANTTNHDQDECHSPLTSVSSPSILINSSCSSRSNTPQPINDHKSSSSSSLLVKKQKIQRPIVYIECESCFQLEQQQLPNQQLQHQSLDNNSGSQQQEEVTTTSSKYKTLSETASTLSSPTTSNVPNQNSLSSVLLSQSSPSSSFINSTPNTNYSSNNNSVQSPSTFSSPLLSDSPSTPSYYLSSDTSSDYLN